MKFVQFVLISAPLLFSCSFSSSEKQNIDSNNSDLELAIEDSTEVEEELPIIYPKGTTILTRINPPKGFVRANVAQNSYGEYVRNIPLKPHGTEVRTFDGSIKPNFNTYVAVMDLAIGHKDLHQCADAVMRLRAEHLWKQEEYDKIHFNFTNGFRVDYTEWMAGKRVVVNGNKTYWTQRNAASNTYEDFWSYLEIVFSYAGTLSLSKELEPITTSEMQIGDVFIYGGSPGHAVVVIDMATNPETNEQLFMLAQSYMPAQEIQILVNPTNENLSPWYSLDFGNQLDTPEWDFSADELMRFPE
jgi:hypothetical protein